MTRPSLPVILLALAIALPPGLAVPAFAADTPNVARPQIGKPVEEAEQFMKARKYKEALARLNAADAVAEKTPYERYIIEATRAAIDLQTGDDPGAIKALQAVLETGLLPPQEALQRREALVQLAYRDKNYAATVAEADRYYQAGGTDPMPRLLAAEAAYQQGDFAAAAKSLTAIVQADDKAGKRPEENVLLMLLSSNQQRKDEAGRIAVLERLVATYPKKEYWAALIVAVAQRPGFPDRLTLDLDRLKAATGVMSTPDEYMEAAQLALLGGVPGDAKSLLDKGFETGVLGKDAQGPREKRLADMAESQAAEQAKSLDQQAKEAAAQPNGQAAAKLGAAYASFRQFDKAIAIYSEALQKGGLDHPEDVTLRLGVAYLLSGKKPQARTTLANLIGKDSAGDLARLWLLQAGA